MSAIDACTDFSALLASRILLASASLFLALEDHQRVDQLGIVLIPHCQGLQQGPEPGCSVACNCSNNCGRSCPRPGFRRIVISCAHMS